jgi:hypothetical protein
MKYLFILIAICYTHVYKVPSVQAGESIIPLEETSTKVPKKPFVVKLTEEVSITIYPILENVNYHGFEYIVHKNKRYTKAFADDSKVRRFYDFDGKGPPPINTEGH